MIFLLIRFNQLSVNAFVDYMGEQFIIFVSIDIMRYNRIRPLFQYLLSMIILFLEYCSTINDLSLFINEYHMSYLDFENESNSD